MRSNIRIARELVRIAFDIIRNYKVESKMIVREIENELDEENCDIMPLYEFDSKYKIAGAWLDGTGNNTIDGVPVADYYDDRSGKKSGFNIILKQLGLKMAWDGKDDIIVVKDDLEADAPTMNAPKNPFNSSHGKRNRNLWNNQYSWESQYSAMPIAASRKKR